MKNDIDAGDGRRVVVRSECKRMKNYIKRAFQGDFKKYQHFSRLHLALFFSQHRISHQHSQMVKICLREWNYFNGKITFNLIAHKWVNNRPTTDFDVWFIVILSRSRRFSFIPTWRTWTSMKTMFLKLK